MQHYIIIHSAILFCFLLFFWLFLRLCFSECTTRLSLNSYLDFVVVFTKQTSFTFTLTHTHIDCASDTRTQKQIHLSNNKISCLPTHTHMPQILPVLCQYRTRTVGYFVNKITILASVVIRKQPNQIVNKVFRGYSHIEI